MPTPRPHAESAATPEYFFSKTVGDRSARTFPPHRGATFVNPGRLVVRSDPWRENRPGADAGGRGPGDGLSYPSSQAAFRPSANTGPPLPTPEEKFPVTHHRLQLLR